jgi:hypothetical protein
VKRPRDLAAKKMTFGFLKRLFRRKPKGRISVSAYRRHHERELKRNPGRFEREQEQARRWSMRVANQTRKESGRKQEETQ